MSTDSKPFQQTLVDFYGKENLMREFGTLSPTVTERTEFFDRLWDEFGEEHEITITASVTTGTPGYSRAASVRRELGPFNVIRHGSNLRFRNKEDMTYAVLTYGL